MTAAAWLEQAALALMQAAREGANHGPLGGGLQDCVFKQLRQLITSLGASQL